MYEATKVACNQDDQMGRNNICSIKLINEWNLKYVKTTYHYILINFWQECSDWRVSKLKSNMKIHAQCV